MSVADVTSRYHAASLTLASDTAGGPAGVELHELAWASMHAAVGLVRDLRRAAADGVSRQLEDVIATAAAWCRRLAGAPLAPQHPGLQSAELAASFRGHVASELDPGQRSRLERLAGLVEEVRGQPHPASVCLEAVLSRYGRNQPHDPPPVYIAAEADQTALVATWLAEEELDAEVRPVGGLRDAPVREALVLLGPPTRYLASPWCPPAQAARRGGWLITAPPARHVHVLTWPGHPRFDGNGAAIFPMTAPVSITVERRGDQTAAPGAEPVWIAPAPVEQRITVTTSWARDRDPVQAIGIRLAGDAVAFYDAAGEHRPEVVTWDTASVQLLDTDIRRLTVGTALLFRPARSAADGELHSRADELLATKYGPMTLRAAQEAKQELKDAYARSVRTDEELIASLTSKLNDRQYARHIVHWLPDTGYIAPEKPGAYEAARASLLLPPDTDGRKYGLLRALRGACRRAGIEITRDLIEVLRSTKGWQADVEADGMALVSAGERFGQLDLRIVTAVDLNRRPMGRSRLGHLLPDPDPGTYRGGEP